jgi:hypothetical protein
MQFELANKQPAEENETPITWVKWYEGTKEEGSSFTIRADRVSFKDDNNAFYIVDQDENKGISVFAAHHPNATFTDATPHGVRLANAIGRHYEIEGSTSAQDLCDLINDDESVITVEVKKTKKGLLWSISTN